MAVSEENKQEAVAFRNYEQFHGLPEGSAIREQVQQSSAGIQGWASHHARFKGRWDGGYIRDTTLRWNDGMRASIDVITPEKFTTTLSSGVVLTAVFEEDGKLHWSDGQVWQKMVILSPIKWGLGERRRDNCLRLGVFVVIHLATFAANVFVLFKFCLGLSAQDHVLSGLLAYVLLLGAALMLVGVYCIHVSWRDVHIKKLTDHWCGSLSRILLCSILGLTQLIQLRVAYTKYLLREEKVEDESDSDVEHMNSGAHSSQRSSNRIRRREMQRVAMLENISPWAFPSKCFEGIFEGGIFALVLLYAIMKASFHSGAEISNLYNHWQTYALMCLSGCLSFCTVGISTMNFDYHLSPSVQKVVDHSVRYTIAHVVFRACESASRVVIVVWMSLGFRTCDSFFVRSIPYLILVVDYIACFGLLLKLSPTQGYGSCAKRFISAIFMGVLLLLANLAEFVDETEHGVLHTAAARFSKAIRGLRVLEILALFVLLCTGFPCRCVLDDKDGQPLPPETFTQMLWDRHKITSAAFIVAVVIYHFAIVLGFHRLALRCSRNQDQIISRQLTWWRWLRLPNPRYYFEASRHVDSQDANRARHRLLSDDTEGMSMTASSASIPAEGRRVPIAQASEADLPPSMRVDINEGRSQAFPFTSVDLRSRRAFDLAGLLISRGFAGPLAKFALTPIDENLEASMPAADSDKGSPPNVIPNSFEQVQIADFRDLGCLGRGVHASVSKVELLKTSRKGQEFAMKKLLKKQYCVDRSTQGSLPMVSRNEYENERQMLDICGRHPNVASLEWAFELDNYWILVMEFCQLKSLVDFTRKHGDPGLDVDLTRSLGEHILRGLSYLHQHNILHRDVKPGNVGVAGDCLRPLETAIAKLIDFGFAKCADACQSTTICGSYGYVAPEIDEAAHRFGPLQQADRFFDYRIDLYSFGVLLFVTFVGREATNDWSNPRQGTTCSGQYWSHSQFRAMLMSSEHALWQCQRYVNADIFAPFVWAEMEDSGLLQTVSELTQTVPDRRPISAQAALRLPFFQEDLEGSIASHSMQSSTPSTR